jgi:hypothetical protein
MYSIYLLKFSVTVFANITTNIYRTQIVYTNLLLKKVIGLKLLFLKLSPREEKMSSQA